MIAAPIDARVLGPFTMLARVTDAIGVPGEHRGQRLRRSWTIEPGDCTGSVCARLLVRRSRGRGGVDRVVLRRVGRGRWVGGGAFWVALRCRGRVHRHGSHVPYRLTLRVTDAVQVQGISFARAISATYVNERRTDATRCPMGPSHDAARYTGRATGSIPVPPSASFTDRVDPVTRTASFTDTSQDAAGVVAWAWDFGDPASGASDSSNQADPTHTYSAPGSYQVTLTVTDANGLTATVTQTVTVPGLAPGEASRSRG